MESHVIVRIIPSDHLFLKIARIANAALHKCPGKFKCYSILLSALAVLYVLCVLSLLSVLLFLSPICPVCPCQRGEGVYIMYIYMVLWQGTARVGSSRSEK